MNYQGTSLTLGQQLAFYITMHEGGGSLEESVFVQHSLWLEALQLSKKGILVSKTSSKFPPQTFYAIAPQAMPFWVQNQRGLKERWDEHISQDQRPSYTWLTHA